MADLGPGHIKGSAIREFARWLRVRLGDPEIYALIAGIPDAHRASFDPAHETFGILASTWYPAPVVHSLCDAFTDGLSRVQQSALARDGSRALMEGTLKGVYRVLFEKIVSPERFAALAPRVWGTYFDSGERRTFIISATKHESSVRGWRAHHPFLCQVQMHATTWMYEATGCRGAASVLVSCVNEGAGECRWTSSWAR